MTPLKIPYAHVGKKQGYTLSDDFTEKPRFPVLDVSQPANAVYVWLVEPELPPVPLPKLGGKLPRYDRRSRGGFLAEEHTEYQGIIRGRLTFSVNGSQKYSVELSKCGKQRACTCPDYRHRRRDCKHIYAALMFFFYERIRPHLVCVEFEALAPQVQSLVKVAVELLDGHPRLTT